MVLQTPRNFERSFILGYPSTTHLRSPVHAHGTGQAWLKREYQSHMPFSLGKRNPPLPKVSFFKTILTIDIASYTRAKTPLTSSSPRIFLFNQVGPHIFLILALRVKPLLGPADPWTTFPCSAPSLGTVPAHRQPCPQK